MKRVTVRRASSILTAALVALAAPWLSALPASAGQDHGSSHPSRHLRGYAALGDSYSSGEGSGRYQAGTDTDTNRCHRSSRAYGPLLRSNNPRLKPLSFVACSGALTHDLYAANHQYAGEGPQLAALTKRTKAVSLTIGGNDAGFVDSVKACLQLGPTGGFGCSQSAPLNAAINARIAGLAGLASVPDGQGNLITPISTVLADIHQRAPQAKIYLAGYPDLFGSEASTFSADPSAPSGSSCVLNAAVGARIDYADVQWFNANTQKLNAVFQSAVQQARTSGIRATYVSPSTFNGHGLCDAKTSWIQPLLLTADGTLSPESLHPTPAGQRRGYARAFHRAGL
ncbi:MAG: SGNH/GDSL hydrolase family protein [Propionibacteriaceae bacterium]